MSINVLNAHGQQIHVFPKHTFQQRGKQPLLRPSHSGNNDYNDGRGWTEACAPVKFVTVSKPIFSTCFLLATVVFVTCAVYLIMVLPKDVLVMNYVVAVILTLCILYILFVCFFKVKDETIVLIPSFGIQLQKSYALGRISTQFIPYDAVKDVVINEAISMYKVIYYLVLILICPSSVTQTSVIPLFTHSWPRLDILCEIYNVCQDALPSHQQQNFHQIKEDENETYSINKNI